MFRQLWVLLRLLGNTTCKVLGLKLHSFKHTAQPCRSMRARWSLQSYLQTYSKLSTSMRVSHHCTNPGQNIATFPHLDSSSLVESFRDLVCHLSASADLYLRRNRRLEASQILEQLNDPRWIQKRWIMGNLPMHHQFPGPQSRSQVYVYCTCTQIRTHNISIFYVRM